ncbi:MAG TPA: hypothetical protein VFQ76_08245, partial [Longimicrobiaceae bacterium]|nr:hypothetical protein [Longimicrobiaceae bacterium]
MALALTLSGFSHPGDDGLQSALAKLHAEIQSRKRPHWDVAATARSAGMGVALALIAFLLGIRAAEAG